jgi:hypothetical protein
MEDRRSEFKFAESNIARFSYSMEFIGFVKLSEVQRTTNIKIYLTLF